MRSQSDIIPIQAKESKVKRKNLSSGRLSDFAPAHSLRARVWPCAPKSVLNLVSSLEPGF